MRLTLFGKFLLLLVPPFVVLASVGLGVARGLEARDDADDLAARVGSQSGRIAAALARHGAADRPDLATDLLAAFAGEPAVLCAELRDGAGLRLASYPAVVGCTAQVPSDRFDLAVGEEGEHQLAVGYTRADLAVQARRHALVAAVAVSAAFLATMVSAGLGFRLLISCRLDRLHRAITGIGSDGARMRVQGAGGRDELGDIIRAYNALADREDRREAELRGAHAQLHDLSRRDPLTGAFNRRHVQACIDAVASACERDGARAALALFDIDHFKRINDRHGHGVGDEVLVEVVRRIGRTVGADDLFARWGGEEFLLCVGDAGPGGIDDLARRLLACLADESVVTSAGPVAVTASIGIVPFPLRHAGRARSWADAVTVADAALYQAKASGRACAVRAEVRGPGEPAPGDGAGDTVRMACGDLPVRWRRVDLPGR